MVKIKIDKGIRKIIIVYSVILIVLGLAIVLLAEMNDNNDTSHKSNTEGNYDYVIEDKDVIKKKYDISKISVYRTKTNKIETMSLDDYVIGVVSAEMPALFEEEALKAQAVAARTYGINKIIKHCGNAHGADICDSTHCQAYMNKSERMKTWDKDHGEEYYEKISNAVKATSGEVITYKNNMITNPQYFAVSPGKTEDAKDVFSKDIPYLKSVSSEGEDEATKYESSVEVKYDEFIKKLKDYDKNIKLSSTGLSSKIKITDYTSAGAVKNVSVNKVNVSGITFRKLFNLNSTYFKISFKSGSVIFSCKGYGHDVGMSQWGARVMAREGKSYKEILSHYYTGTDVTKY